VLKQGRLEAHRTLGKRTVDFDEIDRIEPGTQGSLRGSLVHLRSGAPLWLGGIEPDDLKDAISEWPTKVRLEPSNDGAPEARTRIIDFELAETEAENEAHDDAEHGDAEHGDAEHGEQRQLIRRR
jgi:hypothetical protein